MKTILVDAASTLFLDDGSIDEKLHTLLETYPNKKIVLTNANDEQMPMFGIDKSPYEVFTLKHNPDKVDPVYFTKFMEKYGFKPEDLVYFEHTPDAVKAGEPHGISTYYFDETKRNLVALKKFLDDNINI